MSATDKSEGSFKRLFPYVLVAASSVLVYANTLSGDFVYDDILNVLENPWITDTRYLADILLTLPLLLAAYDASHREKGARIADYAKGYLPYLALSAAERSRNTGKPSVSIRRCTTPASTWGWPSSRRDRWKRRSRNFRSC